VTAQAAIDGGARGAWALGENLVGVPSGPQHHVEDAPDELIGDVLVEEVRHRVDEDPAGLLRSEWKIEALWPEAKVELLLVGMPGDTAEPLGKGECVAVVVPRGNLHAPSGGVPCCPYRGNGNETAVQAEMTTGTGCTGSQSSNAGGGICNERADTAEGRVTSKQAQRRRARPTARQADREKGIRVIGCEARKECERVMGYIGGCEINGLNDCVGVYVRSPDNHLTFKRTIVMTTWCSLGVVVGCLNFTW
jgi:hypothetical protein